MSTTSSPLANQHNKPLTHSPFTQRAASRTMQMVQEARTKIAELTAEVDQLRETHKEDQGRIEELSVEAAHLQAAHKKEEARISELTNEGVRLRLKYEDLKEQVNSVLPPDTMDFMLAMNEVSDRNEKLLVQKSELEMEVGKLKDEIQKLVKNQENNWTAFQAGAVELPESSSEGDTNSDGILGGSKSQKLQRTGRLCDGGVM